MNRDEVLSVLRREKAKLEAKYGLVAIGVFGSVARGDARADSDVDIVVDLPIVNAWSYLDLRKELTLVLGGKVDIVRLRPGLRESFRRRIESEVVFV